MAASRRSGVRAFVTAVVLTLAALLGAESVSAQAMGQGMRPANAAAAQAGLPYEHSGTAEDDCKPRHGPRRSAGSQALTRAPGRVCGCDAGAAREEIRAESITERERVARGRSVDRTVLQQTFRC
ncbi:hypothetical protein [Streptomyces sp. WMMB 322]|uniref:hypothetical protein n=1 Tax=Streptomyces sp. WMMB 322 TaxID=1286821 RepID=UPI0006E2E5E3|nr:hypothetical protein [Streptomyces sp. WMMB 322]SCK58427.1 hypothetical protein H180DRAFT_05548 [Streptomyces sp. WMMB 322]